MLKSMYKLYTRHTFEHMLFQYMHSHYLVLESKEDENGENENHKMLGYKSRTNPLIGSTLKPGIFYVRDTNENVRFHVTCRCK